MTKKINEEDLLLVAGGIANPNSDLTEEEAYEIAKKLGEGYNRGDWRTMSGEEFMQWWRSTQNTEL